MCGMNKIIIPYKIRNTHNFLSHVCFESKTVTKNLIIPMDAPVFIIDIINKFDQHHEE